MFRFLLFMVFLVSASYAQGQCGVSDKVRRKRIVDGSDATPGAWPWIVSIKRHGLHQCGGTILSKTKILTAAHCFDPDEVMEGVTIPVGPEDFKVIAGAHDIDKEEKDQQVMKVKKFALHPEYNKNNVNSPDLAIIELSGELTFNERVNAACLPKKDTRPDEGTNCYILGWGHTKLDALRGAEKLQEAEVPVKKYLKDVDQIHVGFPDKKDGNGAACKNDSGGPLMCKNKEKKWVVEGALNWGNCQDNSVYTPVAKYVDWIEKNI
ncbi:chymotrypsinogen B-like [Clytia hemisphaerica]|uniref:Peptidase S1 domain-containing protein n=1 Tax=Clytia hemisphaerica TaxID=252671 RepID=A0A7M5VFN5_9CNID